MGYVKVIKNKAYFKRYQVKFRRRRQGKTDYRQRLRLVHVDKNKYQIPKHRLVVRISNNYVLAQIVYATLKGDRVLAQASSRELPRYGVKVGLKNYAAAYCTGLLAARRVLKKVKMDGIYKGVSEVTGEVSTVEDDKRTFFVEEVAEDRRPFRCYLDVGTRATTTGARIFGVLKGASDGGLDIPHNHKRFPGFEKTDDGDVYTAEVHRDRIFGQHVAEHMRSLDGDDLQRQYGAYLKAGVSPDDLEGIYEAAHRAIKEDPSPAPKKAAYKGDTKFRKGVKLTHAARKAAVAAKKERHIAALRAMMAEQDDESDVEED